MTNVDNKGYWRWRMVRQVSDFINDPREKNAKLLIELIEAYPSIHRELETSDHIMAIQPDPAEFVCSVGI